MEKIAVIIVDKQAFFRAGVRQVEKRLRQADVASDLYVNSGVGRKVLQNRHGLVGGSVVADQQPQIRELLIENRTDLWL